MKTKHLPDGGVVVCNFHRESNGFSHTAAYYNDGKRVAFNRVVWCNRTWEAWDFEVAISGLLQKLPSNFLTEDLLSFAKRGNFDLEARPVRDHGETKTFMATNRKHSDEA